MKEENLLLLGALGVGAFILYDPIKKVGDNIGNATSGLGMGISNIGESAGVIATSTGQTYKDLAENTSSILDSTGSAISKNIDIIGNIPSYGIGLVKEIIDKTTSGNYKWKGGNNQKENITPVPKNITLPMTYKIPDLPKSFEASIIEEAIIKPISTTSNSNEPNYKNSILYIGDKKSVVQTKTQTVQPTAKKSSASSSKTSSKAPTNTTSKPSVGQNSGTYKGPTGQTYKVSKTTYKPGHRLYKG